MRVFGTTASGETIHAAMLSWPGGIAVEVLEFGAIVHRIAVPTSSGSRDVVLSLDALADYEADTQYIGPIVGRVANRIARGCFPLDGRPVQVSINEPPNTLHGGKVGFDKRTWRIAPDSLSERQITLAYTSPEGEEGFPGGLSLQATYSLIAFDTLEIAYTATCDAPTAVNLSQHLYFNLSGDPTLSVLDHTLSIRAARITPVGPGLIPTGALKPVAGSAFDLCAGRRVGEVLAEGAGDPQIELAGGFDHNWALDPGEAPALTLAAPDGVTLHLSTDQPGLQLYSGQGLKPPFTPYAAVVIEPQGYPDAVNHSDFPSPILRPGETYRRRSRYRFTA